MQNRAAELARIEQTLIELAQLFQDVSRCYPSCHFCIVLIG